MHGWSDAAKRRQLEHHVGDPRTVVAVAVFDDDDVPDTYGGLIRHGGLDDNIVELFNAVGDPAVLPLAHIVSYSTWTLPAS